MYTGDIDYTAENYLHAAKVLRNLEPRECHTVFYPHKDKFAAKLEGAATWPDNPKNISALDALRLFVWVPFLGPPHDKPKNE